MASRMNDDWYRKAAKDKFEDEGTIEFDDEPKTSPNDDGDNGCYVQAWVWVYDPDPTKMTDMDKTLFRNPKITDDEINQLIEEYS